MSYGFEVYNSAGNVVVSSNDKLFVAYQRYFLSIASTSTSSITSWDYRPQLTAYPKVNVETYNSSRPLYSYSWPAGLTPNIDHLYGFNVPYGRSVFTSTIYNTNPAYRLIYSDSNQLEMISAGPLQALSNYPAAHGMIVYDNTGTAIYHSDARIMKIATRLNNTLTYDANGLSPYVFFTGNWCFHQDSAVLAERGLRYTGCKLNSATSYSRRVIRIGSTLTSNVDWEVDPLGSAFIGLVNKALF